MNYEEAKDIIDKHIIAIYKVGSRYRICEMFDCVCPLSLYTLCQYRTSEKDPFEKEVEKLSTETKWKTAKKKWDKLQEIHRCDLEKKLNFKIVPFRKDLMDRYTIIRQKSTTSPNRV